METSNVFKYSSILDNRLNHIDNLTKVKTIINSKDHTKLLEYKEFHLEKIYYFLQYYNFEVVKYVLDNAVNLECNNYEKKRPIHDICENENGLVMLKYIVSLGVNL